MELNDAAQKLEALGNTTRLSIVRLLIQAGEIGLPVGEIQRELAVPGSTLSHHLAKLVQVGLVRQDRESRVLRCRADYPNLSGIVEFLMEKCCARSGCG